MANDPRDRPPKDLKAELEDALVKRTLEPYASKLDDADREGMRIFMNLFVKTHPAMQSMVDRRLKEEATQEAARIAATAPTEAVASGVQPKGPAVGAERPEPTAADASGILRKGQADGDEDKPKAGGAR